MAGTPFIDILTPAQRVTVARKSRGDKRPYYYDGTLAQTQERLKTTGTEESSLGAEVQISEDLEAMFILMNPLDKGKLLAFLADAIKVSSSMSGDDFALITEVVAVRKAGYAQIYTDVGSKTSGYDAVRRNILGLVEQFAHQSVTNPTEATGRPDPTSVVIPDLGALFASLADSYRVLATPDILAIHDRIADTGTLYAYQNATLHSVKELSSWVAVVTLYLV
jgi:hypothetical protein